MDKYRYDSAGNLTHIDCRSVNRAIQNTCDSRLYSLEDDP